MSNIVPVQGKKGMYKKTKAIVVSSKSIIETGKRIGITNNNGTDKYVIGVPKKSK